MRTSDIIATMAGPWDAVSCARRASVVTQSRIEVHRRPTDPQARRDFLQCSGTLLEQC